MSAWDAGRFRADVIVLTALEEELRELREVTAGAVPASTWEPVSGPYGLPVWFRSFVAEGDCVFDIAATAAADMGARAAIHALQPLVEALEPRWIAMCGVCAGRRGKVQLGDVIAAERVFFYDTGEQRPQGIQQDINTYQLRDDWKRALEQFPAAEHFAAERWLLERPWPTEWRENHALKALHEGLDQPATRNDPQLGVDGWKDIVANLRKQELLEATSRAPTEKGRAQVAELEFQYPNGLPDLSPIGKDRPFRLRVAPIGSGTRVIEDETIWGLITQAVRATGGLEMEAAALGELAHRERSKRIIDAVVMKGVMDFADEGRNDQFKRFAARASAECLLWFLRRHVAPELARADRTDGSQRPTRTVASASTSDVGDDDADFAAPPRIYGREELFARLDQLLVHDTTDRWVVVTGGPGMGKSTILGEWRRRRRLVGAFVAYHAIHREQYGSEAAQIVSEIAAQIERHYPDPQRVVRPEWRLADLLRSVSKQLVARGDKLVLIIDGLDEYSAPPGTVNPLARILPRVLPPGVRLLCATRPAHLYPDAVATSDASTRVDLDDASEREQNVAAVRAFWAEHAPALGLDRRLVDDACEAASGNMQFAVMSNSYLASMPAGERDSAARQLFGDLDDRLQSTAVGIPPKLGALLAFAWARIAASDVAVQGLSILCAAREPLTLDELSAVAGWDEAASGALPVARTGVQEREQFKRIALEFLIETKRSRDVSDYRIHHQSFREYIAKQLPASAMYGHHAALAHKLASWPPPADPTMRRYALRHALAHRVEAAAWTDVGKVACDVGFLETKCRELGVHEVETDLARTAIQCRSQGQEELAGILDDLWRATARESHWLRSEPGAIAAQLWNRLRRSGWSIQDLDQRLSLPPGAADFVRVRRVVSRESPAFMRKLNGHTGILNDCVLARDGRWVVSCSVDKTLKIWDLATGTLLTTLRGHAAPVTTCALAGDDRRIVSGSSDGIVKIWDIDRAIARDTDTDDCSIATWTAHGGAVNGCAVTEGNQIVSVSSDKTLRIWELETGGSVAQFDGQSELNSCTLVASNVCVVGAEDGSVQVWDLAAGDFQPLPGHRDGVTHCAVTADGARVVSASRDQTLRVWDRAAGATIAVLTGHKGRVNRCAIAPEENHVVSASADKTIKVWSFAGELVATHPGHTFSVNGCTVTRDGRRIVSASSDGSIRFWDFDVRPIATVQAGHEDRVNHCAVTADDHRIVTASSDNTLKLWDRDTGEVVITLTGHEHGVNSCAVTGDARYVVSASDDQTVRIWDAETGESNSLKQHTWVVSDCAVTAKHVISASWDKTIKVWDLDGGQFVDSLKDDGTDVVNTCVAVRGGRHVLSAAGTVLRLWDLETKSVIRWKSPDNDAELRSCTVAPDGELAVLAFRDGLLKTVHLGSSDVRVVRTIPAHTGCVASCAISPDGRYIVSASWDSTLKIWDLATGAALVTHRGSAEFTSVVATATTIYAGDMDGTLWFLDWPSSLRGGARPVRDVEFTIGRDELLRKLSRSLPAQFEEVLFRMDAPMQLLSGTSASQTVRAIDAIRYFEQARQLAELARTTDDVLGRV